MAAGAPTSPWRGGPLRCRDTGIAAATGGLARVVVAAGGEEGDADGRAASVEASPWLTAADDVTLLYVLDGRAVLELGERGPVELRRGSAATLVRDERFRLTPSDHALQLLDVAISPP